MHSLYRATVELNDTVPSDGSS